MSILTSKPIVTSLILSFVLHGALVALFLPYASKTPSLVKASFELVWEKPTMSAKAKRDGNINKKSGLLRFARNDEVGSAKKSTNPSLRGAKATKQPRNLHLFSGHHCTQTEIRNQSKNQTRPTPTVIPAPSLVIPAKAGIQNNTKKSKSLRPASTDNYAPTQPHTPLPTYPWVCRKRGQEGVVHLDIKTNENGRVVAVTLHTSSGHSLLDKAALESVKSWILAESNFQKTLSIAFRLEGKEVSLS